LLVTKLFTLTGVLERGVPVASEVAVTVDVEETGMVVKAVPAVAVE
jgi:hypothetical protein